MLNLLTSKNPSSHDEDILRQAHVSRRDNSNQSINSTMQHAACTQYPAPVPADSCTAQQEIKSVVSHEAQKLNWL